MSDNHINFIKRTIDSIPIPTRQGERFYFYDIKINGLELMVTSTGVKSFKVYRKVNGKPVRVTLGKYPIMTVEQARKEAHGVIVELMKGNNPNEKKKKIASETKFGELFELFMDRHSKPNRKTWESDERMVQLFLTQWFGKKISHLTKHDVQAVHEKIRSENGLYRANRVLSIVQLIYNKAIEWGWIGINPTNGIKKFKEKSRDRFLHPDELPRFFKSLEVEENDAIKDYISISLFTGARKANVLGMRWDEISLERKEWLIPETKNGEALRVHLIDDVIEILKRRAAVYGKKGWVFQGVGATGHLVEPKKGWKRILDRAGISNLRLHDLRRTLGSYQAATGANSYIIGRSLGHKSAQATAIYARLSIDPVRDSVEKATKAMLDYAR